MFPNKCRGPGTGNRIRNAGTGFQNTDDSETLCDHKCHCNSYTFHYEVSIASRQRIWFTRDI